jgi:hypothetical protein
MTEFVCLQTPKASSVSGKGDRSVFPPLTKYHVQHRYSETNMMHILFDLLRIKGLYMFRALLAHPQEAFHKRHLVYCVRVMSVGCTRIEVEPVHFNSGASN